MIVRHGVMLVGLTGTGKSTCNKILAKALTQLANDGNTSDPWYKSVHIDTLNPKAVTMGELFGETNIFTMEWTEGLVSKLFKDAVAALESEKPDAKRWINFDGPVDALWIENMNTVLDDNKMLCLPNGQRIKMPNTCTMMFEVQDLRVASPATVSRCGMVYLEPVHLGWKPIIKSWHEHMVDEIPVQFLDIIVKHVENIFEKLFPFVREQCKEIIETVDMNLVQSCLNMIQAFLNPDTLEKLKRTAVYPEKVILTYIVFSLIWSLGGNLHDSSRKKFSETIKQEISQIMPEFPDGDVYEYGIDTMTKFAPWNEQIPDFNFDPKRSFFEILVPTGDTVKYKFLL
jgi:dynein heavy chain